ncbi:MAG: pentapeptide repeat-containing protein [Treponema sp.]|nr:pentapeptide repeat-containing protein [Treponema sp.]MCL2252193.1 pentapeptide repeat-containing protein [Treponema sp.]
MKTKITNAQELQRLINENAIKELDLTEFDFTENQINFSGKQLEGIDFSDNKTLRNVLFQKSILIDCMFERAFVDACDFTHAQIKGSGDAKYASFKDAKIYKTKFREAQIDLCDFRYADIIDSTLQGAYLRYTDFYRTAFKGITIFQDAKIESSSLNYISFETFCITSDNLKKNKAGASLVQENHAVYEDFLAKWIRLDNVKNEMSIVEGGLASKYREAERIYRQFSALWEGRGHNKDAEWAYVQGKRMERKRLWFESKDNIFINKLKAILNLLLDVVLGYGVRLLRVIGTYLMLIVIFALIYKLLSNHDIVNCMRLSIGYTIGVRSEASPAIEILSMLQTGMGMLLTGFMGFVVANKVRKS